MAFGETIALYLFLGGTAAGSFAALTIADLCARLGPERSARLAPLRRGLLNARALAATHRRLAQMVYAVALVMIVTGMLCLLADLGRPEAFYLLFLYPTSSLVSIGSFALALFTACVAVALADALLDLEPAARRAALVARWLGTALAFVVMAYTGLLLRNVIAVDLWGSAWLPVLFVCSSLSCGCAVVLLCACASEGFGGVRLWMRSLSAADAVCIVLEALAVVAFALSIDGRVEGRPFSGMAFGDQALPFWIGFVGCGVLVPLIVDVFSLVARRNLRAPGVAACAVLVLAGGVCLRCVLVFAGVQTAV